MGPTIQGKVVNRNRSKDNKSAGINKDFRTFNIHMFSDLKEKLDVMSEQTTILSRESEIIFF